MIQLGGLLHRGVLLVSAGTLLLGGCANPLVAQVEPTPTSVPTPVPPQKPTFKVTRGSITDVVQTLGRVVAEQQQDLYFRVPGHLDNISVTLQDKVKKGQVLAALDTENLKKDIQKQQEALDVARLSIDKAKQSAAGTNAGKQGDIDIAAAGVESAKAKVDIEQAKLAGLQRGVDPNVVAKAQADVTKAQADLQKIQATQTSNQASIQAAQSAIQAAQAKQANLQKGPDPAAIAKAQADIAASQAKLSNIQKGPDPAAIAKAQADIAASQAKLSNIQKGPDAGTVAKAQSDIATTQANLQKLQLAQASNQTAVTAAESALKAAQAKLSTLQAGARPEQLAVLQQAIVQAKNAVYTEQIARDGACGAKGTGSVECNTANARVNTATSALDTATKQYALQTAAPLNSDVASLQSDFDKAKASYDQAASTAKQGDAQLAAAQAEADRAKAAYQSLLNPNQAADLAAAQADAARAKAAYDALVSPNQAADLAAAQADLARAKAGYDALVNQNQNADVASVQADVDKAKAGYDMAVSAARQGEASIASSRAGVEQASASLRAIQNPNNSTDIQTQQGNVAAAQAGVAAAVAGLGKAHDVAGVTVNLDTDVAILEKQASQAQLALDSLNKTLADNTITAPFDGIVISATGQPGDNVLAYTAVITIANPQTLQIAADVPADQVQKIAIGQQATVVMDVFPATTLSATVVALPSTVLGSSNSNPNAPGASSGGSSSSGAKGTVVDRAPKLKVQFPGPGAELGQLARVTITVQKKDDALIIPTRTLNRITNRTFVLTVDKNGKQKPQDITVGISTQDQTEVLTGLKEGDTVVSR